MIRIDIEEEELYRRIDAHRKGWRDKARQRTREFRAAGSYIEGREFWGDIKEVYIDLQHGKCAYCETRLADRILSSKVHEVEHYRPKSRVRGWVPPCSPGSTAPADRPLGRPSRRGYYLLAYHPLNYVIACTRCNSTLKSDYFPVRGARRTRAARPTTADAEQPLLVYPLGRGDVDPARLIRFDGVLAVPRARAPTDRQRAEVTIALFQLNHEDLTLRRAALVAGLWLSLSTLEVPGLPEPVARRHRDALALAQAARGEYAACARDYLALYRRNRKRAALLGDLAANLLFH